MTIFLISMFSTFFGALCGGGASIISTPLFFEIGLPGIVVLAVTKSNSTVYAGAATRNFLREHPFSLRPVVLAAIATLPFAYLGTLTATHISPPALKKVIGALLLAVSIMLCFRRKIEVEKGEKEIQAPKLAGLLSPFAFYEGFFGSGNNVVATAALMKSTHCEIKEAYSMYYLLATAWCGVAAVCYVAAAPESINLLLPCIAGSLIGGHAGSTAALKLSNRRMKILVIVFGIVSGLRLLMA